MHTLGHRDRIEGLSVWRMECRRPEILGQPNPRPHKTIPTRGSWHQLPWRLARGRAGRRQKMVCARRIEEWRLTPVSTHGMDQEMGVFCPSHWRSRLEFPKSGRSDWLVAPQDARRRAQHLREKVGASGAVGEGPGGGAHGKGVRRNNNKQSTLTTQKTNKQSKHK